MSSSRSASRPGDPGDHGAHEVVGRDGVEERRPAAARTPRGRRRGPSRAAARGPGCGAAPAARRPRTRPAPTRRTGSPRWAGSRHGRTSSCTTTVSSTGRAGPPAARRPDSGRIPATSARRSSSVIGREVTTSRSVSLVGCCRPVARGAVEIAAERGLAEDRADERDERVELAHGSIVARHPTRGGPGAAAPRRVPDRSASRGYHPRDDRPRAPDRRRRPGVPVRRVRGRSRRRGRPPPTTATAASPSRGRRRARSPTRRRTASRRRSPSARRSRTGPAARPPPPAPRRASRPRPRRAAGEPGRCRRASASRYHAGPDDAAARRRRAGTPPRDWAAPPPWAGDAGAAAAGPRRAGGRRGRRRRRRRSAAAAGADADRGATPPEARGPRRQRRGPARRPRPGRPALVRAVPRRPGLRPVRAARAADDDLDDEVRGRRRRPPRPARRRSGSGSIADLDDDEPDGRARRPTCRRRAASRRAAPRPPVHDDTRPPAPNPHDQVSRRKAQDPDELFGPAWERPRRYEAYPVAADAGRACRRSAASAAVGDRGARPGRSRRWPCSSSARCCWASASDNPGGGGGADRDAHRRGRPRSPEPDARRRRRRRRSTSWRGATRCRKIANKFELTVEQLLAANPQIKNPNKIEHRGRDHDPGARDGGRRRPSRSRPTAAPSAYLREGRQVDRGDLAGLDAELGVEVLAGGAGAEDDEVRLVGVAQVADVARDHLDALVGPQEPAADLLDAAQRPGVVADVDPHLGALVHQRDGARRRRPSLRRSKNTSIVSVAPMARVYRAGRTGPCGRAVAEAAARRRPPPPPDEPPPLNPPPPPPEPDDDGEFPIVPERGHHPAEVRDRRRAHRARAPSRRRRCRRRTRSRRACCPYQAGT